MDDFFKNVDFKDKKEDKSEDDILKNSDIKSDSESE